MINQTCKNEKSPNTYVLSSGGTGGHLFPAISLAEEIENAGHKCLMVTDQRGALFFKRFDKKPDKLCHVQRKHWMFGRLVYPFSMCFQIIKCIMWLYAKKPTVVVGFGGYPSFPCVFAAQLLNIKTILHEGNAFLGKANRTLEKKAIKIALSFPPSIQQATNEKYTVTGMPVRPEIVKMINESYTAPAPQDLFKILVVGGSQGAKIFSTLIPKAIELLPTKIQNRICITQQCREQQLFDLRKAFKKIPCQKKFQTFLSPMDEYYREAHLVIARAGASTVAEVAMASKPTLFIPFAGSIEGDQAHNAQHLVDHDAAYMMKEGSVTPSKLADFLIRVIQNPDELIEKAQKIKEFSNPNATQNLWKEIESYS